MFALIGENPQLFTKFLYITHLPLSSNHDIRTGWDVSSHWDSHFPFSHFPQQVFKFLFLSCQVINKDLTLWRVYLLIFG